MNSYGHANFEVDLIEHEKWFRHSVFCLTLHWLSGSSASQYISCCSWTFSIGLYCKSELYWDAKCDGEKKLSWDLKNKPNVFNSPIPKSIHSTTCLLIQALLIGLSLAQTRYKTCPSQTVQITAPRGTHCTSLTIIYVIKKHTKLLQLH